MVSVDLDEAIQELQKAVELRPDHAPSHYNLALAYEVKYDVDREIEQLNKVLELDPKHSGATYSLGRAMLKKGLVADAISRLREAVTLDPNYGEAHYQLGLALRRAGKQDEAEVEIKLSRQLIQKAEDGQLASNKYAQAERELSQGETEQAIIHFDEAVRLQPQWGQAYAGLGRALMKMGELDGAIDKFKRALELQPNEFGTYYSFGVALLRKNAAADAIPLFRQAIRLRPSSAEAHNHLGLALAAKGDTSGAAAAFEKALELNPEEAVAHENLEEALRRLGKTRTPKGQWLAVICPLAVQDISPPRRIDRSEAPNGVTKRRNCSVLHLLPLCFLIGLEPVSQTARTPSSQQPALVAGRPTSAAPTPSNATDDVERLASFERYIQENRFLELEPLLQKYVQEHPVSWQGFYQLGYVYFRLHKIGPSVEALARSLQLNLNNAEAHKILGLNLTIVSKYDEAQIELEQGARLKPDSAEVRYFLGRIYYVKNVFPLARREFEEAIRLDPGYMKPYDNLGLTLEALMDDAGALANYQKAVQLNAAQKTKSEWPYINVSAFYSRKVQPDLALEYSQKAIEIIPRSDPAHFEAARAYAARKEYAQAAESLEEAIRINPQSSKYRYMLSNTYRKLGRIQESQGEIEIFRKLSTQEVELFRKMSGRQKDGGPTDTGNEMRKTTEVPAYKNQ